MNNQSSIDRHVTYRSRCGVIYTVCSTDDVTTTRIMHPYPDKKKAEFILQPTYIFKELVAKQELRRISDVQDIPLVEIIKKWKPVAMENTSGYLW